MIDWLRPALGVLREATRVLPAMRYAWGVVALCAAAAIALRLLGSGKAAILAGALAFIGFIVVAAASTALRRGVLLVRPALVLVWAVTCFFVTFLGFTVTAFAAGLPCNWAVFLEVKASSAYCGQGPQSLTLDIRRHVDFSGLKCVDGGGRVDKVVYTDVVKFREGKLPALYTRPFNMSKKAELTVTDLVSMQTHKPNATIGGEEKYGTVNFVIDSQAREARFKWLYEDAHSSDNEGVGFSSAEPYVVGSVDVTYRFDGDPQLTNRRLEPGTLEPVCTRRANGFKCDPLNANAAFAELWHWAVWKNCPAKL